MNNDPVRLRALFERAENFLALRRDTLVRNATVTPHWVDDRAFWYRRALPDQRAEFLLVEAASGTKQQAFDHERVATALGFVLQKSIDPLALPFTTFAYHGGGIRFAVDGVIWDFDDEQASCTSTATEHSDVIAVPSPDGLWVAFVRDHNLWIRATRDTREIALTSDGEEHHAYGVNLALNRVLLSPDYSPIRSRAQVLWSPDSKTLFSYRLDERAVGDMDIVQQVPPQGLRPRRVTWKYPVAGDAHLPRIEPCFFSVDTGRRIHIDVAPIAASLMPPTESRHAVWSTDSSRLHLIVTDRYSKELSLLSIDRASGHVTRPISEVSDTSVSFGVLGRKPPFRVLGDGRILWCSERDGWSHLYLHDPSGTMVRQLTKGAWSVRGILALTESEETAYVLGSSDDSRDDPYEMHVFKVPFSGGAERLTRSGRHHEILSADDSVLDAGIDSLTGAAATSYGFSPHARYFVATASAFDSTPVAYVQSTTTGRAIEIERADLSRLDGIGRPAPERFVARSADDSSDIYCTILRPVHFDPERRYPVIDSIYPGPQICRTTASYLGAIFDRFNAQALAELGFIVVLIDARGTPGRSKRFLDVAYGHLGLGGLDDHVAAIRQMAERYPSFDLDRVGICGISGGGYAALHALLRFPEFFKAGVSAAGNHDLGAYLAYWGDTHMGPYEEAKFEACSNIALAPRLTGNLLLIHGDLDTNVLPAHTLRMADALIRSDKEFDLLIVPNEGHNALRGYALRRAWRFLIEHLDGGMQ